MKKGLIAACLVAAILTFSGCGEDELAPNRISDLATCTAIELDRCIEDMDIFPAETPVIYTTAKLNNATYGVKTTCELRYLESESDNVVTVNFTVDVITEDLSSYLVFYFTSEHPWPAGEYEVTVSTETTGSQPVSKNFRIE